MFPRSRQVEKRGVKSKIMGVGGKICEGRKGLFWFSMGEVRGYSSEEELYPL